MPTILNNYERYQREVLRRSPRTIRNYAPVVGEFLQAVAPDADASQLVKVDRGAVREYLRRPKLSGRLPTAAIWNLRLSAIRSLFEYLVDTDTLAVNPALRIERQKVFSRERVPLSFDELIRLVNASRQHSHSAYRARNTAVLLTLVHTALRVAELVSLDMRQVDAEHQVLADVRVKGGKSLAIVLNDVAAEALNLYMADRTRLHPSAETSALFLSDRGERLSIRSVQDMVSRFSSLAGIQTPVTPHVLRHSAATRLAELGTPLRVVQEICGHASVTTTERYVHVQSGEKRKAMDALAQRWRERAGPN